MVLACQPAAMPDLVQCLLLRQNCVEVMASSTAADITRRSTMDRQAVRVLFHLLDGMELSQGGLLCNAMASAIEAVSAQSVRHQQRFLDLVYAALRSEKGQRQRVLSAVTLHAASLLSLLALSQSSPVVDKVLRVLQEVDFAAAAEAPRLGASVLMAQRVSALLVRLSAVPRGVGEDDGRRRRQRWRRARQLLLSACGAHPYSRVAAIRFLMRAVTEPPPLPPPPSNAQPASEERLLTAPEPEPVGPLLPQSGQLKRRHGAAAPDTAAHGLSRLERSAGQQMLLGLVLDLVRLQEPAQGFLVMADVFQVIYSSSNC